MPIQIPKLNNMQGGSQTAKGQRVQIRAKSNADIIQSRTKALSDTMGEGFNLHKQIQDQQVDKITKQLEQEYVPWQNDQLAKLKNYQGDPAKAYNNFDQEEAELAKSLMEKHSDLSEDAKARIESNLNGIRSKNRIAVLKQRGYQKEVYDHNLYEADLGLKKTGLSTSAGYIQKGDQSSFTPFDMGVTEIKTAIAKRGLEQGTVERLPDDAKTGFNHFYQDSEGNMVKVKLSPIAQQKMAKELSSGISDSVKVLLDSGQRQEAQELMERYQGYIDPVNAAKLDKKIKDVDIKDSAYGFMSGIQDLSEEEQMRKINTVKDVELKSELLKIKDSNDARLESMQKRQVKVNYNTLASRVLEKQNSDQPYYGLADLEKDPIYKQTWDNLDAKARQDIQEMIKAPKNTTQGSEAKVQALLFGETDVEVETVSPEEFQTYLSGLNDKDRRRYTGLYNGIKIESASEKRAVYKRAGSFLQDQMLANELIERNKYGKFDEDEEIELINARNELMDHLAKYGTNLDDKELNDFVKGYVTSKVKERAFNPPPRRKDKSAGTEQLDISPRERISFKKDFRDAFGYLPNSNDEKFKSFVREKKKQ